MWSGASSAFHGFQIGVKSCKRVCKYCRSRQELSNEYLIAKIGFDTTENRPLKVCQQSANVRKTVRINIDHDAHDG